MPMPPPDWQPTDAMVDEVKKGEPEFGAMLSRLKDADPDRFRMELWHWQQEHRHAKDVEQQDPERAKRILRTGALERKVHAQAAMLPASGAARDAKVAELKTSLHELFALREQARRDEIDQLEKRIADLRSSLDDRKSHEDEIVSRRLEELLGKDDVLKW